MKVIKVQLNPSVINLKKIANFPREKKTASEGISLRRKIEKDREHKIFKPKGNVCTKEI